MSQKLVLKPAQAIALSQAIQRFLTDRMLAFAATTKSIPPTESTTTPPAPTCLEFMSVSPLLRVYTRLHEATDSHILRLKVRTEELIALLRVIPQPKEENTELSLVLEQVQQLAANQDQLLNAAA